MMFKELQKNTTSAFDRAKLLVLNRTSEITGSIEIGDDTEGGLTPDFATASDQLDALAEYCPQLTFQQRLIGFTVSFSIGYLITFCSFRFFLHMVTGHPIPFALNYTAGHILQLLASTFLCGPKRQFKNMFDDKRRITSSVYLSCCKREHYIVLA
jgi:Got1/Sft2-like family